MEQIIQVAFKMPDWIRAGLDSGVYEQVGGVIRKIDSKTVVAWLKPATDASGNALEAVPAIGGLPAGAALAAPVAVAATAVIAVVVVGFVVVMKKLERIESKIDKILTHVKDIKEDTTWLRQAVWADKRAAVYAAFKGCEDAERDGRYEQLAPHIATFRASQHFLLQQMDNISALPAPLQSSALFTETGRMYVAITQAKSWAITLASGADVAKAEIVQDAEDYRRKRGIFTAALRQPESHLSNLLGVTTTAWDEAKTELPRLPSASAAEYFEIEGLTLDGPTLTQLRALTASAPNQPCALIIPAGAAPAGWVPER
ncbi:hypothetical protein [Acidocella sp.]|uniref:hypothetical protein n=1 Tax=Acidocella sp. TaxID=50710 RepID=UPI003CFF4D67